MPTIEAVLEHFGGRADLGLTEIIGFLDARAKSAPVKSGRASNS